MGRRRSESVGEARLLDAWSPPSDAGPAVGCFATSYTFDSAFFEEECLARFAGLRSGTSDEERELEWIIECEERFSQIHAGVLVDKDHCRGRRSPRWDLLCARGGPRGGKLHAKLSLLVWARHMRLLVSSANLTPTGYRRNREVAVALDAAPGLPLEQVAWRAGLAYLRDLLPLGGASDAPPIARSDELIAVAESRLAALAGRSELVSDRLRFHGVGSGRGTLFAGLEEHWKDARGAVTDIYAVSPFFDPNDDAARKTVEGLWSLGKQRGEVTLTLSAPVSRDEVEGAVVHAPAAWSKGPRPSTEVVVRGVDQVDSEAKERRPLHAKFIALENDEWQLSAAGSANLTAAGTGVGRTVNWEAVVSCLLRRSHDKKGCDAVDAAYDRISGEEVDAPRFKPLDDEASEDDASAGEPLPDGFESALYRRSGGGAEIVFRFGKTLPQEWSLAQEDKRAFVSERDWSAAGSPLEWVVPWVGLAAPSGFEVSWPGSQGSAWLPVCALSGKDLPPPEVLRELTLDMLIAVLTTARPLAETAAALVKRAQARSDRSVEVDPLKRFDSTGHLIPKTRRVSGALAALRRRLSEPAPTLEALDWRLEGPFGARALLQAMEREWPGTDERLFLAAELCLELSGIEVAPVEGCVPPVTHQGRIAAFIKDVAGTFGGTEAQADIAEYAAAAFGRAVGASR